MAVVYTTHTLVGLRAENIDGTLIQANIEEYIYNAEGILNAVMGLDLTADFDEDRLGHRIVREAATLYAAVQAILYNPAGFTSREEAFGIVNAMWSQFQFLLELLKDKRILEYIEGL